ncbi:MAG: response regulator [Armatimonadetes bacterium]|nr:response regulator [Armatimonadota bacterium]
MDATGKTLLIEDNEDHALLVQSALGDVAPRSVVWLRDGEEALRYLTEGAASGDGVAHPPELILLDMHLPKVSGKEVLRRLRARDALRATPVVMLTTSNDQADVAECYALGANSYVVKPGQFEDLSRKLQAIGAYWCGTNQIRRS